MLFGVCVCECACVGVACCPVRVLSPPVMCEHASMRACVHAWVASGNSHVLYPPSPLPTPIPPFSSLITRAYHTHTRAHFTPQHWLLCHMGLYKFEFQFCFEWNCSPQPTQLSRRRFLHRRSHLSCCRRFFWTRIKHQAPRDIATLTIDSDPRCWLMLLEVKSLAQVASPGARRRWS